MAGNDPKNPEQDKGFRGSLGSARDAIGDSIDRVSGKANRRQFERFTSVLQTTVVGVHRDQQELHKRLVKLENVKPVQPPAPPIPKLLVSTFVLSVIATILAVVAFVETVIR